MKCSTAFCNRPAPMPSFEVPAPFCKWCSENPGSGRVTVSVVGPVPPDVIEDVFYPALYPTKDVALP